MYINFQPFTKNAAGSMPLSPPADVGSKYLNDPRTQDAFWHFTSESKYFPWMNRKTFEEFIRSARWLHEQFGDLMSELRDTAKDRYVDPERRLQTRNTLLGLLRMEADLLRHYGFKNPEDLDTYFMYLSANSDDPELREKARQYLNDLLKKRQQGK
jgi:hypothetical protein